MSDWIDVKNDLPPLGKYVLIRHTLNNWRDSTDQEGVQYDVAKRIERQECGNNLRPYSWTTFGPMEYFGQDVEFWMPIQKVESRFHIDKP